MQIGRNVIKKYILLITTALLCFMLSGCRSFSITTYEGDPEKYEISYRGDKYYGSEEYSWRLAESKKVGSAEMSKYKVYRSTGIDKYKFLAVWNSLNYNLRGYGTFVREDIELASPSSDNISKIFKGDKEVDEITKYDILNALDSYNNDEVEGIPGAIARNEAERVDLITTFECNHAEYNLFCWIGIYSIDGEYYLYDESGSAEFIIIPNEAGKAIEKKYH